MRQEKAKRNDVECYNIDSLIMDQIRLSAIIYNLRV